jgi:hypothetical protein
MKKEKLLDQYIDKLPKGIVLNIGLEDDNEELFLYRPDFRRAIDKEFKKEMEEAKVWLVAKIEGNYFIVDGSDDVNWIKK